MAVYGRVSGSNHRQELSLPFYEEVLEFLSQGPSAQEIIAFRPGPKAQERFDHLLDINRERPLTVEEEEELDHYIRIEQMMSLLKAKAYSGTSGGVY